MFEQKFAVNINLDGYQLKNVVVHKLSQDPENIKEALFWYNTVDKVLKFSDGQSVVTLASGGDVGEAITMSEAALASGSLIVTSGNGRIMRPYTGGSGLLYSNADGIIRSAIAGEDYVALDSPDELKNKEIDATRNQIKNLDLSNFADSVITDDLGDSTEGQIAAALTIKGYIDQLVAGMGQLVGSFDASQGAFPSQGSGLDNAITRGDYWRVSQAGEIDNFERLEVGDALVAAVDNAEHPEDFFALQTNITDSVTSSVNYSDNNSLVRFDGDNGRIVKGSEIIVSDDGSISLPLGQEYQIGGENILENNIRGYSKHFYSEESWTDMGGGLGYEMQIPSAEHGLGAVSAISVSVRDEDGSSVSVDNRVSSTGRVYIESPAAFSGELLLSAIAIRTPQE